MEIYTKAQNTSHIESNWAKKNLNLLKRKCAEETKDIHNLRDSEGAVTSEKKKKIEKVEDFYSVFYIKHAINSDVTNTFSHVWRPKKFQIHGMPPW